ncbi:MFS transporter [Jiella sonneratiae]|uniref:MFS transporter n=1 Tax=Jiella sonneratiae TaxID=2816856 RepID=A0ABS3J160_9HYPH|nr:MFS transporter [Jiella sonneratiae]MBO0903420.1 MFS transporter [Jiella sonneratiae]
MNRVAAPPATAPIAAARRNAVVLAAAQAIVGSAAPVAISTGGLAGAWLLLEDKSLATLPVTGFNLGVALGALPAAALMRAIGRRLGFTSGALVVSLGGLCAALSLLAQSFWPFVASLILVGCGNAFTQQYRFAATDGAPSDYQSRAIGLVLAGGMFAAVIGPQMVNFTTELFRPAEFAGAYFGLSILGLLGVAVLSALRINAPAAAPAAGEAERPARPLAEIVSQPRFLTALLCGVGSFAMMSFVMTGAPLAIVACGHPQQVGFFGIQWHVMAMFAPSFFTGRLIARYGKERIIAAGLLSLLASFATFLSGTAVWQFWLGLVLLGLGWNFGFIGATAMVAETHRPSEKNKTQGFHDLVLFSTVAFSSFMSGRVFVSSGWETMNLVALPVGLTCLAAIAVEARRAGHRLVAG